MSQATNQRHLINLSIAWEALRVNRVRSLLTALGIIFGVAAVIAMLAIGKGAKVEILKQLELVGVNNIEVKPIVEQTEKDVEESNDDDISKKFSKGLDLKDAFGLEKILPGIKNMSPEVVINSSLISNGKRRSAKLIGVWPNYFEVSNIELASGQMFTEAQMRRGAAVCIIGSSIEKKFFPGASAMGRSIKCGNQWFKIIGITKSKNISENAQSELGIRDYNMDIYTPINSVLTRYEDRSLLKIDQGEFWDDESAPKVVNYHQLDKLIVQMERSEDLDAASDIIRRYLKRRHNEVVDYEIVIPEHLLEQQQKTKDIFNLVLAVIAGISLIVGGIGIMNIMLASVLERTREIGTRLAIGAKKTDIISQFLFESILISLTGGIAGILLGITGAFIIQWLADITTIVSWEAILISFIVSSSIGILFGWSPARRAALQDPVDSLRYE
jgi:putative ABC transport system permease protein